MKINWKVQEAPTGRYRSFSKRGWPFGSYTGDKPAVQILCEECYSAAIVKTGEHTELKVMVADWSVPEGSFRWRTLVKRFATLAEAKEGAKIFLETHPEFYPKEDNK